MILLATVLTGLACAQSIPQRENNQQRRIAQGVRSGALTPAETARLQREERASHRRTVIDRRDGGVFTPAERARAQRRLDHISGDIARLKHNGRVR
ncbi:MAG: hypothetical protein HY858_04060 [Candidatus Solibacter usitatus]|nr:hypothetical protein [Candidatus Solibacter usitatus]